MRPVSLQPKVWNICLSMCSSTSHSCNFLRHNSHGTVYFIARFREELPGIGPALSYIPFCRVIVEGKSFKYYDDAEVEKLVVSLKRYQEAVDDGRQGARENLKSFIDDGLKNVKDCLKRSKAWMGWQKEADAMEVARIEERNRAFSTYLTPLHYSRPDICEVICKANEYHSRVPLTTFAWRAMRLQVETKVHHAWSKRMLQLTQTLCQTYQDLTLLPRTRLTPGLSTLSGWRMFTKAVEKNWNAKLQASQCCTATPSAPLTFEALLKEWNRSRRRDFYLKMVKGGAWHLAETVYTTELKRYLSLATSFLVCRAKCTDDPIPIRTFDESFGQHFCSSGVKSYWDFDALMFDRAASEAIATCVEAAGLDPSTTTWREMDELDARFCCINCPAGVYARSWRSCALHPKTHPSFKFQGWAKLSDERAAIVIRSEASEDQPPRLVLSGDPNWHELLTSHQINTHIRWMYDRPVTADDMCWDPRVPPPAIPLGHRAVKLHIASARPKRKSWNPFREKCSLCYNSEYFNACELREHITECHTVYDDKYMGRKYRISYKVLRHCPDPS
ncbi:hypothetical protein FRB95_009747 [Tulasnella sp. JGI-2019a]|nr:hypothetical protein FRB95_009747 [Tulasnella sp. JGI-2019a]